MKSKAINCPHCGSPNSESISANKYKCKNCDVVYVIENHKNPPPVSPDKFEDFDYEKLKKARSSDFKFTLIIIGTIILLIGIFALYGLWSHNWRLFK
jgi:rubredoxin